MRFYEKHFENNYEELITYYPRFYRDVFEMAEVLKANGRIFDGLEGGIEQAYLDCFIDHAGEEAIAKLEKFLHIGLDRSRSIEERRRLVKSYFVGFGKVSASLICRMIGAYTNASVSCRFEPSGREGNGLLYIDFRRRGGETIYMSDILTLLSRKLPAHIAYRPEVVYRFPVAIGRRRTHHRYGYDCAGTKPDTALLGVSVVRDAVTQPERRSVRLYYKQADRTGELAGTHPEEAVKAVYFSRGAAAEQGHESGISTYGAAGAGRQAGTEPEAAAIARNLGQTAVISQKVGIYTAGYEKAARTALTGAGRGMETVEGGKVIDAATGATATGYSVDYTPCGTAFTER